MKKQKIIDYTTNVPVERTLPEIEKLLQRFGVTKSMRDYANGEVVGLSFSILLQNGKEIYFRMPCDADKVFTIIMRGYKRKQRGTEKKVREQSAKIAWRLLYDSLAADLSRIELGQIRPEQLFFGQIINPETGQTFFEVVEERGFKMLGAGQ